MNPRARRLRRERRRYRTRVDALVCRADLPIPEHLHWDFEADTITWGSSRIPLDTVRRRRWPWECGGERLSEDAKQRLARFMGPSLTGDILRPHPTYRERWERRLEP
jgi:hypothetical protein